MLLLLFNINSLLSRFSHFHSFATTIVGTLWKFNITIENGRVEIVDLHDLPIENGDFP